MDKVTDALGLTIDFKCDLCGRTFTKGHALSAHKNWHKNRQMLVELSRQATLKRWEKEREGKFKKWASVSDDELLKLNHEKKLTLKEIGEMFGVSEGAVHSRFRKHGLQAMRWYDWQKRMPPKEELEEKLQQMTVQEAMRYYHVWSYAIWKWIKHYGIKLKRSRKIHKCRPSRQLHDELVFKEVSFLEKQGYRVIPLVKVVPDAIAIKGDNLRVYAVEVERGVKEYIDFEKYSQTKCYDDVIWIIERIVHHGSHYKEQMDKLKKSFQNIIVRESV